jgi:hypothetical protein
MKTEVEIDWEAEYVGWQKSGLSQREYSEKSGYTLAVFKNGMTRTGCRQRLKKEGAAKKRKRSKNRILDNEKTSVFFPIPG